MKKEKRIYNLRLYPETIKKLDLLVICLSYKWRRRITVNEALEWVIEECKK